MVGWEDFWHYCYLSLSHQTSGKPPQAELSMQLTRNNGYRSLGFENLKKVPNLKIESFLALLVFQLSPSSLA